MKGSFKGFAVVLSHNEGNFLVRMPLDEESGDCGGCKICQTCGSEKNKFIDVSVSFSKGEIPPSVGSRVMIEYHRRDPGLAAILFFAPPLVGLVGGGYLFRWAGADSDGFFLVGAASGLLAGIGLAWIVSRLFPFLFRQEGKLVNNTYTGVR